MFSDHGKLWPNLLEKCAVAFIILLCSCSKTVVDSNEHINEFRYRHPELAGITFTPVLLLFIAFCLEAFRGTS